MIILDEAQEDVPAYDPPSYDYVMAQQAGPVDTHSPPPAPEPPSPARRAQPAPTRLPQPARPAQPSYPSRPSPSISISTLSAPPRRLQIIAQPPLPALPTAKPLPPRPPLHVARYSAPALSLPQAQYPPPPPRTPLAPPPLTNPTHLPPPPPAPSSPIDALTSLLSQGLSLVQREIQYAQQSGRHGAGDAEGHKRAREEMRAKVRELREVLRGGELHRFGGGAGVGGDPRGAGVGVRGAGCGRSCGRGCGAGCGGREGRRMRKVQREVEMDELNGRGTRRSGRRF